VPSPAPAQRQAAATIAAKLARLGFALPGTIAPRHVRCGKPGCRCQADPPVLHGPYPTWTRKVAGRTVTRRLTDDQYAACRPWLEAGRRARELLAELETLSAEIMESELRSATGQPTARGARRRKTPAT
jgi:hypothetical protein